MLRRSAIRHWLELLGLTISVSLYLSASAKGQGRAESPELALLEKADKAFHDGLSERDKPALSRRSFREAANGYSKLAAQGAHNTLLFRNLGNASLLGGDLAGAVLAYRRGLRISPDDAGLHAGLLAVRERVANAAGGSFGATPEPLLPSGMPALSVRVIYVLTFALYALTWVLITRWWMTRHTGLGWAAFSSTLLFATSLSALLLMLGQAYWEEQHPLVVIAGERVYLYKGDGSSYSRYNAARRQWIDSTAETDFTVLPAGVEARLLFERDAWLQIQLASGEVGWVPRFAVVIDRTG